MAKGIIPIVTEKDMRFMEKPLSAGYVEHKYAVRLQTVLNRAGGVPANTAASVPGIDLNGASNYVKRYREGGIENLPRDKTGKPGKAPIPPGVKNRLARFARQEKPKGGAHWSARELSKRFEISHTAVNTILREQDIKPHLVKKFQFSADKEFERKLEDAVGLYLDPPEDSIVFCVGEKTQIQALERARPIPPLRPGIPEGQTHGYERRGAATLFAALNTAGGKVTGKRAKNHKAQGYVDFLKALDRKAPKGKVLHIIADNNSSHKAPAVKEYIEKKSGRFVAHFIPAYSSRLNMIERRFAEITNKRIRRESRGSLKELEEAIIDYIISRNEPGRKFLWTKNFCDIKTSIEKAKNYL